MSAFANAVIEWQKVHGRHDLPWQNTIDPYAIWVSEIMLQQTQVTAVIGYYAAFMQRFPDIATLANATQEEVLQVIYTMPRKPSLMNLMVFFQLNLMIFNAYLVSAVLLLQRFQPLL
jgi:predicted ATPase